MNDWSFVENEQAQLRNWSQLTYAERLDWLWEAKMFAQRALDAARARSIGAITPLFQEGTRSEPDDCHVKDPVGATVIDAPQIETGAAPPRSAPHTPEDRASPGRAHG